MWHQRTRWIIAHVSRMLTVLLDQKPSKQITQIQWLKLRSNRTAAFWVQYATNAILVHLKLNPPGTWKSIWQQSCLPSVDATTAASAAAAGSACKKFAGFFSPATCRRHVTRRPLVSSWTIGVARPIASLPHHHPSEPALQSPAKFSRQWSQRSNFTCETYDSWLIGFQTFHPFFGRFFQQISSTCWWRVCHPTSHGIVPWRGSSGRAPGPGWHEKPSPGGICSHQITGCGPEIHPVFCKKKRSRFFLGFFLVASCKWKKNTDIQVIFKNSWACRQEAPLECSLHFSLTQTDWTSLHNSTSPLLPTSMIQAHENPKCAWIIGLWHGLRFKMVIERSKMQSNQPLWPAARTSERRCPRAGASPGATTHIWLFRYLEVGHPVKLQWNLTVDLSWTQNTQVIASSTKQEIPERQKKPFSRDITWPTNTGSLWSLGLYEGWPLLDDFFFVPQLGYQAASVTSFAECASANLPSFISIDNWLIGMGILLFSVQKSPGQPPAMYIKPCKTWDKLW